MNFENFLRWERASRDSIDVKVCYIDIAGDLCAGLLLSQVLYWHLPGRDGRSKLRVHRDGKDWLVKAAGDWWQEIRLTEKQARRALAILAERGLVETMVARFNGAPTTHIHLNRDAFCQALTHVLDSQGESRFALEGRTDLPQGAEQNCPRGRVNNIDLAENTQESTLAASPQNAPSDSSETEQLSEEEDSETPPPVLTPAWYQWRQREEDAKRTRPRQRRLPQAASA